MKPEDLRRNIAGTLYEMKRQTGKEPGGPSGLCHKVVVGALTGNGEKLVFQQAPDRMSQKREEIVMGLNSYPISIQGVTPQEALPAVLTQEEVPLDAVIVTGISREFHRGHEIAVVPNDGKGPYAIVDSLLSGALLEGQEVDDVSHFMDRFSHVIDLYVVPIEKQRERPRFFYPQKGVFALFPPTI